MGKWFCSGYWTFSVLCTVIIIIKGDDEGKDQTGFSVKPNNLISASRSTPAPKILLEIGKDWKNITAGDVVGGDPIGGVHTVYSEKGDDLFLSCSASYPIRWNISGRITPPEVVKFQQPKRNIKKNIFKIQINVFFLDAEDFKDLAASAVISCHEIGYPENRDEIAVFVKGNKKQSLLPPIKTLLEGEINVIPCPSTDPKSSSKPSLSFKNSPNQPEKLIENVVYNPVQGFRYDSSSKTKIFNSGIYTCKKDAQIVTFNVTDSLPPTQESDSQFSPTSSNIRRFSDEPIEFECSSKTKPVQLIFDHANETILEIITNLEKSKVYKIARDTSTKDYKISKTLKGRTACLAQGDSLIKEWSWEFLEAPQLYLDNHEGEADCLSQLTPKLVQTVRCANEMDCDFMGSSCLGNKNLCNFKKQKQFFGDRDTFCWVDELGKGMDCVSVPFSHLNGIVKCGVMDLAREWQFFISLDYLRYSNWNDAPLRELVRISEISDASSDAATNSAENTKFVCTASAYLFADSLAFEIQYRNGSSQLIQSEDEMKSTQSRYKKPRQILELYVKAVLDKKMISKDAVSIDCLAPFWNSTDVLKASKVFVGGRERKIAAMSAKNEEPSVLEQVDKDTFYIGETNKRLNCSFQDRGDANGFDAKATWLFREMESSEKSFKRVGKLFPELIEGVYNETGDYFLEFPQVEKKYEGIYECAVLRGGDENNNSGEMMSDAEIGSKMVWKKYELNVSADPLPTSTTVYVGLTILILVIVGLGIAAFAVFLQKRNT